MTAVSGSSGGGGAGGVSSVGAPSAANSGGEGIAPGGSSSKDNFTMKLNQVDEHGGQIA